MKIPQTAHSHNEVLDLIAARTGEHIERKLRAETDAWLTNTATRLQKRVHEQDFTKDDLFELLGIKKMQYTNLSKDMVREIDEVRAYAQRYDLDWEDTLEHTIIDDTINLTAADLRAKRDKLDNLIAIQDQFEKVDRILSKIQDEEDKGAYANSPEVKAIYNKWLTLHSAGI